MRTAHRRAIGRRDPVAARVAAGLDGGARAIAQSPADRQDLTFIVGYTQPPVTVNPFKRA